MLITSKDNSKIKEVRKLLDKKYSFEKKLFVIEGENLITEAIKNNLLAELYILKGYECDIKFSYDEVTNDVMKTMSDLKSTPRMIGIAKFNEHNILGKRVVILDDVQDPGNAGTIIRNSVAFGVDTVVFSNNSVSPYNEKVLRSTGGMIFNINIIVDDVLTIINKLKSDNINIIGTSLNKSIPLKSLEKTSNYAIILGNEGNGVKKNILSNCDSVVRIEMNDACESLNVGVSSGILLYELYRGE